MFVCLFVRSSIFLFFDMTTTKFTTTTTTAEIICSDPEQRFSIFCDLIKEFDLLPAEQDYLLLFSDNENDNENDNGNGNDGNGNTVVDGSSIIGGGGGITVFAPTDKAFALKEMADRLEDHSTSSSSELGSLEELEYVLLYHVVVAKDIFTFDNLRCQGLVETLNGQNSRTKCDNDNDNDNDNVTKYQKGTSNDNDDITMLPKIIEADIMACNNGIVHVVDHVLMPDLDQMPAAAAANAATPSSSTTAKTTTTTTHKPTSKPTDISR